MGLLGFWVCFAYGCLLYICMIDCFAATLVGYCKVVVEFWLPGLLVFNLLVVLLALSDLFVVAVLFRDVSCYVVSCLLLVVFTWVLWLLDLF